MSVRASTDPASDETQAGRQGSPERQEPGGCEVLLVEDDPVTGLAVSLTLGERGYAVHSAADGREALDYVHGHPPPRVILLDLVMPGMDGWQFRQQQQQDAALAGIPVVVMSGAADRDQEALAVDAAGYFLKPYDIRTLLELVGCHCPGPASASYGSQDTSRTVRA
jgi:CheY-like chemotaxis protein